MAARSIDKVVYGRLAADTTIRGIVGQTTLGSYKIFPNRRPQGEDGNPPCIVYTVVSEVETYSHDGATNSPEYRVQVDCYGGTGGEEISLYNAVRAPAKAQGSAGTGPLSGYSGATNTGSVTVQHSFIEDSRDSDDPPETGRQFGWPICSVDFRIRIET